MYAPLRRCVGSGSLSRACCFLYAVILIMLMYCYNVEQKEAEQLADARRCELVSPGPPGYTMLDALRSWPANKTRGFIYLTVNPGGVELLAINLAKNVYVNFNQQFRYPLVIFSESPDVARILRAAIARLGAEGSKVGQVFVYDVSRFWVLPDHIMGRHNNSMDAFMTYCYRSILKSGCSYPGTLGYWLMCRFQSKGITEIPFIQNFEYLWRLDRDSSLCRRIEYDIFAYMKENDFWQGYLAEDTIDSCAEMLTEHVHRFVREHDIKPAQGYKSIDDARTWYIYNNFEIFKVQFCLSDEYQLFMDFIELTGGFFYYRWGDAPVRTQASRLFMPKLKMREFKLGEIYYQHQSFRRC